MLDASHSTGYHNSSFHISSVINFLFLIGSGLAIHQLETSTCCSVESSCNSHFSGDSVIAGHKMSLSQDESIVESYPSCVNTVGIRAVDSQSSHYRHKRPEQYAVITKTSTTSRDSFMTVSQGPPIGTYNVSCVSSLINKLFQFLTCFSKIYSFQQPSIRTLVIVEPRQVSYLMAGALLYWRVMPLTTKAPERNARR